MQLRRLVQVLLVSIAAGGSLIASEHAVWVSPSGNDQNPGTFDQPFFSLQRARDAIREFRTSTPDFHSPVVVYLRGGRYTLTAPLELDVRDGGSSASPVIYTAYQNETPVISGALELRRWTVRRAGTQELWVTQLPEELGSPAPLLLQLWVGDERRQQARHPNTGYLAIAALPGELPETPWNQGRRSL